MGLKILKQGNPIAHVKKKKYISQVFTGSYVVA